MSIAISLKPHILKTDYAKIPSISVFSPLQHLSNKASHKVYQAKHALYSSGDTFKGLYFLRSGSAKASIISKQGQELLTDFFLPGDLMGTDGFNQNIHTQNIRFLETSSVLCLSATEVKELLANSEEFRCDLLNRMSQSMMREQHMLLTYSCSSSEQRVAKFFLQLSERFDALGCSAFAFLLSMTRTDIANYLGMAIETLSRLLTQFQQEQILKINHRYIEISNKQKLEIKAGLRGDIEQIPTNCVFQ